MGKELVLASETDREGLNFDKVAHFLSVGILGKTTDADAYLEEFTDFEVGALRCVTGKALHDVLLDVDACIAPPYGPILDKNLGHIDNLKSRGMRFGVYSNCKGMERLDPLREMGVPIYSGNKAKPAASGFIEVCQSMDFDPESTWMVGDNPLTDGGAVGVLEGMAFVRPIEVDKRYVPSRSKRAKLALSGWLRQLAIFRTVSGNDKIIRLGNRK